MNKYYFVFVFAQHDPIPVMGETHNNLDGSLSIFDSEGNITGYFPKDKWHGFLVEFIDEEMSDENEELSNTCSHGH